MSTVLFVPAPRWRRRRAGCPSRSIEDCGQATLMVAAVVVCAAAVIVALGATGQRIGDHQRARAGADAAALAGTTGGVTAARKLATANGAVLIGFREVGDRVTVTVRVGDAVVTAHASDGP
jgi:Flp pilus assembly protein TadG